jgi:uncharacterized protein involved in propanediol utilization
MAAHLLNSKLSNLASARRNVKAQSIVARHAIGRGCAIGHHGEILQGVVRDREGRLHRALVTLPCMLVRSEATFRPDDTGCVTVSPPGMVKARAVTELALAHLGMAHAGGALTISNNMPQSWGFGSSTSDVVAALRAVASAFDHTFGRDRLALMAVEAEVASDPTMFEQAAVLFAQREGVVLEHFGLPLPALEVLGLNTDPAGVDTLAYAPAEYDWWETQAFGPLLALLRKAILVRDVRLVGRVASASARLNQRHLPTRGFDRLEKLVEEAGAVGCQVAHSGTLVGLLFDPDDRLLERRMAYAENELRNLGIEAMWRFRTGDDNDWSRLGGIGSPERVSDGRGCDRASAHHSTEGQPLRRRLLLDEAVSCEVHPARGSR